MSDDPQIRVLHDPTTGRPILMAPQRRKRPYMFSRSTRPSACPFCTGEEHQTPPEVDAIRADGSAANGPGWRVRAIPNLYPATAHHEVVIEGSEHTLQPAELDEELWHDALRLYERRIRAIEAQPGIACAYLFKNVGQRAGASIAHNHSQVLGLPMLPPRLELELDRARIYATEGHAHACAHCAEVATAEADGRMILATPHHVVLCPAAPKQSYETWLLPRDHSADFLAPSEAQRRDLAATLQRLFTLLDRAFDDATFNIFLHRVPGADFHWHWEVMPRVANFAGLELGGDMYINAVEAGEAAARLRAAADA